jgi:hypothetical protein
VITLSTPFAYDGTDNLEMLFENNNGSYSNNFPYFYVTTGYSTNRVRRDYNDASFPSSCVNCGAYANLPNIQLTLACTSTLSISPSSPSVCVGNSTSISASGMSSYTWSPSTGLSNANSASVSANPTTTTTYTIAGKDGSNCIQTKNITVTVNSLPTISASPSTTTICNGNSAALTAGGATTYTWSPATGLNVVSGTNVTASPTVTTSYNVSGTNSNGCVGSNSVSITVNPKPSLTFSPASPSICIGSNTSITASGATTYSWTPATGLNITSGATVTANPTVTTTYTINATGTGGCTGSQTLVVTVNQLPTLTVSPASPSVCNGSSTSLTASGATTFTWSPTASLSSANGTTVTASPTVATTYTLSGTNANGCTNNTSFSVAVNSLPAISINPASTTICIGANASLTASGANTYTWNPTTGLNATTGASITASPSTNTTYTVSATNTNGCVGTQTIAVTVNALPVITINPASPAICIGTSTSLTASGANSYTWSPNTGLNATNSANVIANPTATTIYTVSGTNATNCVGTKTVTLTVNPLPIITTSPAVPIVLGGQGPTITANGASTYTWSPATNLSSINGTTVTAMPQITSGYTVTGTNANGCVNSTALSVGVELWQQTADTFKAPIYYNGSVGIGTNNPQAALDVVGNAIITGTLTSGGLNSTNANLRVTTPAIFAQPVTFTSLAGGTGGIQPVYVDSTGNLKLGTVPNPNVNPIPITSVASCNTGNPAWLTGGNKLNAITNAVLGTCDNHNLVFESNSIQSLFLVPNTTANATSLLGIGTSTPGALLHVNTLSTGTLPGLIVDNANPTGGPPEFIVNSDGSLTINDYLPTNGDILDLNNQSLDAHGTDNILTNLFRVTGGGHVGIGNSTTDISTNPTAYLSAYKTLTVNGDVSLANNPDGQSDGVNGIEILGNNAKPTRRGISVDGNPDGDFNFYINSTQASSEFNFVNGANGAISSSNPALLTIGSDGSITSNALALSTATTNRNLTVDPTGKIIADAGSTGSAWVLGGNAENNIGTAGQAIGTTDQTDMPFITANIERMRISGTTGNIIISGQTNINVSGAIGSTPVDALVIKDVSNSNTINFKVNTNGQTYAREVIVSLKDFPDYVFKPDYKLMPLGEVKSYIEINHHLPNMPSSADVEKDGANLGEIQRVSVEKIEELTLYMLEIKKEMDKQNKEIEKLKQENKELKSLINK